MIDCCLPGEEGDIEAGRGREPPAQGPREAAPRPGGRRRGPLHVRLPRPPRPPPPARRRGPELPLQALCRRVRAREQQELGDRGAGHLRPHPLRAQVLRPGRHRRRRGARVRHLCPERGRRARAVHHGVWTGWEREDLPPEGSWVWL